jgi:CDGSH iron-sulfur domain-containing protein 3
MDTNLPKVAATAPSAIQLEKDKIYAWCTCGLSQKQPFCDGAHKTIPLNELGEMPFKSHRFSVEADGEYWLCNCKHTKNAPFCDGSHKQFVTE